jgi:hypothetical protein
VSLSLLCFAGISEAQVSGLHFSHSHTDTQLDGEFAHGEISDPGHGRKEHVIAGR